MNLNENDEKVAGDIAHGIKIFYSDALAEDALTELIDSETEIGVVFLHPFDYDDYWVFRKDDLVSEWLRNALFRGKKLLEIVQKIKINLPKVDVEESIIEVGAIMGGDKVSHVLVMTQNRPTHYVFQTEVRRNIHDTTASSLGHQPYYPIVFDFSEGYIRVLLRHVGNNWQFPMVPIPKIEVTDFRLQLYVLEHMGNWPEVLGPVKGYSKHLVCLTTDRTLKNANAGFRKDWFEIPDAQHKMQNKEEERAILAEAIGILYSQKNM